MFDGHIWLWIGFNLVVLALLALDLGVFQRHAHAVPIKEAAIWTVVWIVLSLLFAGAIYLFWDVWMPNSEYGAQQATLEFLTGYVIEKSLSVDNIFVFVLIFSYFAVPNAYQHRVLFWGVLGAMIMRGILIVIGATLIEHFSWILYIFGAFLIITAVRMFFQKDEKIHPENNPVVKFFRRWLPVTDDYREEHLFVREAGKLMATPLFIVLVMIESTDLVFAVDSIPAVFAVTREPFLVYSSNVCAILGLRALYFVLNDVMVRFIYLKPALALVLGFVGVKMMIEDIYHIPILASLGVVLGILTVAVIASLIRTRNQSAEEIEAASGLPTRQAGGQEPEASS